MTTTSERSRAANVAAPPGAALSIALFASMAAVIAIAAWRTGTWGAILASAAAVAGILLARRSGYAAGLTAGARARDDLHAHLVSVEADLVKVRLSALRDPSAERDRALADALTRAEAAENALAEAQSQQRAVRDFAEGALADERRKAQAYREQAERALAEARQQAHAAHDQTDNAFTAERSQHMAATAELQRQLVEERKRAEQAIAEEAKKRQALQREIERLAAEAANRKDDQRGALREVERVLAPWIEREKLLLDLARLDGKGGRSDLPTILDAIASKAAFASVVLSDESGLPVAASRGCRDAENAAATSSLLFTLADRLAECGAPAPISVLVHDDANETILHRLFRAGSARYLLTATGRGRGVAPETLDPTLASIERCLLRESLVS